MYQINPVEPKIYVYNNDRKLINTYNHAPPFYKKITNDLSENPFSNISKFKKTRNWTWTIAIHFIEPIFLIVQYYDMSSKKFFFDISDVYGNCYTNGVETSEKILATNETSIFIAHQPPMENDGKLPNPILIQYKFNFMK